MAYITKKTYLNTLTCPTLGWLSYRKLIPETLDLPDQLRIEEGLEIHQRAKSLYPDAIKGYIGTIDKKTIKQYIYKPASQYLEITLTWQKPEKAGPDLRRINAELVKLHGQNEKEVRVRGHK